ncbi:hypothetical protein FACS1894160_3020 [Bacteroidia bacterium]|nr:hypothetical protein FACS1894160_3020 [Bacteroidia bacterium]
MGNKINVTPNGVSKNGVSKTAKKYEAPKIEILEVVVEKGFAQSSPGINPGDGPRGERPSW